MKNHIVGWEEIYFSMNREEYYSKQAILREHNIPFKAKIMDNLLRLSMNNLDGRSPVLSRSEPNETHYYRIYVQKESYHIAKQLMG